MKPSNILTRSRILRRRDSLKRGDGLKRGDFLDRKDYLHHRKRHLARPKFAFLIPPAIAAAIKLAALAAAAGLIAEGVDDLHEEWKEKAVAEWDEEEVAEAIYEGFDTEAMNNDIADEAFDECSKNDEDLKDIADAYVEGEVTEDVIYNYCENVPPIKGKPTPKNILKWVRDHVAAIGTAVFAIFIVEEIAQIIGFTASRVEERGSTMSWACNDLVESAEKSIKYNKKEAALVSLQKADEVIDDMKDFCDKHGDYEGSVPGMIDARESEKWEAVSWWESKFKDKYFD
jgi:hypothetical protein